MNNTTHRALLILATFSLILSIFASVGPIGEVRASGTTYTAHSTITISGNSDLSALRSSGGCTGSGTVTDPYVINGFDITGTGGACIYIAHITVRLVISNCYLHGNYYGVEVIGSNFVTVTNNNCSGNDPYGIYLDYTGNDTLTNNVCIDAAHGIYTYGSGDNIMKNNTCRATRACAIMMDGHSNRNTLSDNTCYSSGDNGIYVLFSNYNTLSNNTLKNNRGHGIHLAASNYNSVYGNLMISNNGSSSVYNGRPQSDDTGTGNHWNTGSYGNYWSDWTAPDNNSDGIIDKPYWIAQGSSKDYFPLAKPTIPTVPGVPTGFTVVAGNGISSLSWSAPSSNGGAAIDYYIVYQNGVDVMHASGTSYTVTGLTSGQTYSFKVAAHNTVGIGTQSAAISTTPVKAPDAPTGLIGTAGNGQVALNWTAPSLNGGASIDYYIVYQNGVDVMHVASTSTTITGLTNGQGYSFAVAAHNSAGTGAQTPSVSSIPMTMPNAPAGLTAVPGNGQVALNWTAPSSSGGAVIDYYILYQNGVDIAHPTVTKYTSTGLTRLPYTFMVATHTQAGNGPNSNTVVSTPFTIPGAPNGLTAIAGNGQVALNWTEPSSNGGTSIDYYIVYQNSVDVKHVTGISYIVTGLTNGLSYSFKVAAHNTAGIGLQTSSVISTPATVPGTPTGWGGAKLLETTSGNASTPQVAVSANGNAMAVWQQDDGTYYNIYARSYSSGAWGTMNLIETENGMVDSPQVAMDNNGNAVVVWRQYDGAYYSVYANRYSAGAWETAKLLETVNGDVQTPQVAMDSNGNAISVWTQYDGAYYSTYANRYTSGAWGTAKLLETAIGNSQTSQIAMDSNGNAVVTWVQVDNVWRLSIYASKYTNAVGWGAAYLLETSNIDASTPQVAMDNNGNAVVVWSQSGNIYANRFTAGAWGTAQLIETSTVWATGPQVAMDNNGSAVAAWTEGGSIYANRFTAGAWGTAQLLSKSAGWGMGPQLAMDNSGNAIAAWAQGGSIYANRFTAGAWGTAQLLETGAGDAFVPQLATGSTGNAFAVWQQNDGSRLSIYGNVYVKA
jgi:parallel beta-helix repeat protein